MSSRKKFNILVPKFTFISFIIYIFILLNIILLLLILLLFYELFIIVFKNWIIILNQIFIRIFLLTL